MSDAGSAWKEAGERVAALGTSLKRHYDERSASGPGESAPDLREAARRLTDAVRDAVDSLGAAAQEDEGPLVADPFDEDCRLEEPKAKKRAFFRKHYYGEPGEEGSLAWRRIDADYLAAANELALKLDSDT